LKDKKNWYTYLLICADKSIYCGVTTDLKRREKEHNTSKKGARYTSIRRPVTLVYAEQFTSRSLACIRESEIKKLKKNKKIDLINKQN